jgi:hypothetical protein
MSDNLENQIKATKLALARLQIKNMFGALGHDDLDIDVDNISLEVKNDPAMIGYGSISQDEREQQDVIFIPKDFVK